MAKIMGYFRNFVARHVAHYIARNAQRSAAVVETGL